MARRRTRTPWWTVGATVGVLLAGTACGSSSGSAAGTPARDGKGSTTTIKAGADTVDVCKVVTAEDAGTVFGAPAQMTDPEGTQGGALGVCIYEGVNESFTVRNLLQARVYASAVYYGEKVFPSARPLPGIGDKAFINVNETGHVVDIQFVSGGRTGALNYSGGSAVDVTTKVEPLKALAEKLAKAV